MFFIFGNVHTKLQRQMANRCKIWAFTQFVLLSISGNFNFVWQRVQYSR